MKLRRVASCFFCFTGGAVVAANLSGLVEINPDYDYAWWKVALAGFLALMGLLINAQEGEE